MMTTSTENLCIMEWERHKLDVTEKKYLHSMCGVMILLVKMVCIFFKIIILEERTGFVS